MKKIFFLAFLLVFQLASLAELNIIAHEETYPGRCFIVFLDNRQDVKEAAVVFNSKEYRFYKYEDGLRAIVPIALGEKKGEKSYSVTAKLDSGSVESCEKSIFINPGPYKKVSFALSPSKQKIINSSAPVDEWLDIEKKLIVESPDKLWNGFFCRPVPGDTTMSFGKYEYVNGKYRSQHKGWDFRANIGSKVLAPSSGYVIYTGFLKAYGGTVALDHGQGINTLYFHLSKILVENGQYVNKGEVFALSGNSGISSGPHLHWAMSVHNVRVDPKQWVMTVMP